MADQTITFDANITKLVQDTDKASKEMSAGAKGFAKQVDQSFQSMIKIAAVAKAVAESMRAGAEEYRKIKEDSKDLNKTALDLSRRAGIAGQRTGLGGRAAALINTAEGTTSRQERLGMLEARASDKDFLQLSESDQIQALNLQFSGAFADQEVSDAIKRRRVGALAQTRSQREALLGAGYTAQVAEARQTRNQELAKEEIVRGQSINASEAKLLAERARLENPGAAAIGTGISEGLGKVPIVGSVLQEGSEFAQEQGFKALSGESGVVVNLLKVLVRNTTPIGKVDLPLDPDR